MIVDLVFYWGDIIKINVCNRKVCFELLFFCYKLNEILVGVYILMFLFLGMIWGKF